MSPAGKAPICPECNRPATGNFCQNCGAKLGGRFCNQCGGKMAAGAGFCNQCGTKAGASPAGGHRAAAVAAVSGQNLAWWVAGAAMFGLILVVGFSMVGRAGPVAPSSATGSAAGAAAGGAAAVDLASMSPREAADRLFDRVMRSASQGDSASAQAFLPMAIAAYDRAQPLDHDGLFHLSLLQRTAGDLEASLATARAILEGDPDYVLGLNAAAASAIELGRPEEAAEYYRHLLDVYDAQLARGLPEYEMHSPIMASSKAEAEAFLVGR